MSVTATYPQTGPHGGPGVLGPWKPLPRRPAGSAPPFRRLRAVLLREGR